MHSTLCSFLILRLMPEDPRKFPSWDWGTRVEDGNATHAHETCQDRPEKELEIETNLEALELRAHPCFYILLVCDAGERRLKRSFAGRATWEGTTTILSHVCWPLLFSSSTVVAVERHTLRPVPSKERLVALAS